MEFKEVEKEENEKYDTFTVTLERATDTVGRIRLDSSSLFDRVDWTVPIGFCRVACVELSRVESPVSS